MRTIKIKHTLSQDLGDTRDTIVYATIEIDEFGRYGEPSITVTTGNGRQVHDERVLDAAREAIACEIDRRVELQDHGCSPTQDEEDD